MQNIFALRKADAKIFRTEFALRIVAAKLMRKFFASRICDEKIFSLRIVDAKIFRIEFLSCEVLCFPLFWTSLVFDRQKLN